MREIVVTLPGPAPFMPVVQVVIPVYDGHSYKYAVRYFQRGCVYGCVQGWDRHDHSPCACSYYIIQRELPVGG